MTSDSQSRSFRGGITVAVVVAMALLAHAASLGCGWIWDDDSYVTANPILSSPTGFVDVFRPGTTPQYYPLVFAGFWIQESVTGIDAFSFHLVNVLMHAANAALLVVLLRRIGVPHAAWIGALFAVHPMGVESVAWVTERKNVQSMLFALASIWCFLRAFEPQEARASAAGQGGGRRMRAQPAAFWVASLLLFACALLSKTTAVFVPPALLLLALWRRTPRGAPVLLALAPFFALGIALGLFTAHVERTQVGASGGEFALGLVERVQLAGQIALFYPRQFLLPLDQIFIYPRLDVDVARVALWIPATIVLTTLAIGCLRWRRTRGLLAWTLVYLATVFPALGFFDVWPFRYSQVADHFAYAAMPLLSLAVVVALETMAARLSPAADGRRAAIVAAVAGAFVAVSIPLSLRATAKYESAEVLWTATAAQNERAWIAHNNLATFSLRRAEAALGAGDADSVRVYAQQALARARRAGELKPDDFANAVNRSEAHRLLGSHADALVEIDRAIAMAPTMADLHWMRARALELLGQRDKAREALRRCAEHGQGGADELRARRDLMRLATLAGDRVAAIDECRAALALAPDDAELLADLGSLLAADGRIEEGRQTLERALRTPESFSSTDAWVAALTRYLGIAIESRLSEAERQSALAYAGNLLRIAPSDAGALFLREALRLSQGDEGARAPLVAMEADARRVGAAEFADRVAEFLAQHPAKP